MHQNTIIGFIFNKGKKRMQAMSSSGSFQISSSRFLASPDVKNQITDYVINASFTRDSSYESLCDSVKANMETLATLRNPIARYTNSFISHDVATSMQEVLILLAMKKFHCSDVNQVEPNQIKRVIFDLIGISQNGVMKYDTTVGYKHDLWVLSQGECNVDDGKARLQARLQTMKITNVSEIVGRSQAGYQAPVEMAIALRPPEQYSGDQRNAASLPPNTSNATTLSAPSQLTNQDEYSSLDVEDKGKEKEKTSQKPSRLWKHSHENGIPKCIEGIDGIKTVAEVRFGDMNGNPILAIQQLIHTGVLSVKDEDTYKSMMALLDNNLYVDGSVKDGYPYDPEFRTLLENTLEHNEQSTASVLFLGDMINDKIGNDLYILDITDLLSKLGVNYKIVASNHDFGAIRGYLKLKGSSVADKKALIFSGSEAAGKNQLVKDNFTSFSSCMQTLAAQTKVNGDLLDQYMNGMENYLKHIVVYQFSDSTKLLCGHAPPSEYSVNAIAKQAGMAHPEEAELGLKVDVVNRWLQEVVLTSTQQFERYYRDTTNDPELDEDLPFFNTNYSDYPLYSATSGTGCTCNDCHSKAELRDGKGRWMENGSFVNVNYTKPQGADNVEHGHIWRPHGLEKHENVTTLDSNLGCPDKHWGNLFLDNVYGRHKVGITRYADSV